MYLQRAIIRRSGPILDLDLTLPFHRDGAPKPLILVGRNGTGKTNFLSLVTDALIDAATEHHQNVLPGQTPMVRPWFRIVGGATTTVGHAGGFTLLRFDDAGESRTYWQKAGTFDPAQANLPEDLRPLATWPVEGNVKQFNIPAPRSEKIFREGVYVFFPATRSEVPYWLNREVIPERMNFEPSVTGRLTKPILVERALSEFKEWLIAIILESKVDFQVMPDGQVGVASYWQHALQSRPMLQKANELLQIILDDPNARFVWLGRKTPEKLAIASGAEIILPTIDGLSAGQATLLAVFGTLLRYADASAKGPVTDVAKVEGVCLVDEVDAHIHVDLQHRALPALISTFPRIQFIVASHSPLFVLGMENTRGSEGILVLDMSSGLPMAPQSYSEFESALAAFRSTEAFSNEVLATAQQSGKPIVYLEGETDPEYLRCAARILNRSDLLDQVDIEWIGAKDSNQQGFNTGHKALDQALSLFKAKPDLALRKTLLLYDNDTNKQQEDINAVSVRIMPTNAGNEQVRTGIENLLSPDFIKEDDYQVVENRKPNGDVHTIKTLRKSQLCARVCAEATQEDVSEFGRALDLIAEFAEGP